MTVRNSNRIIEQEVRGQAPKTRGSRCQRREGQGAKGVGFRERMSHYLMSGSGKGLCPLQKFFLIFEFKMVRFGAFWVLFFTVFTVAG